MEIKELITYWVMNGLKEKQDRNQKTPRAKQKQ